MNRVLPLGQLEAEAIATAERLARRPAAAIRGLKRSVYEGSAGSLEQGLAAERKWFMSEAGLEQSLREMEAFVAEVERRGGSPWATEEGLRPWQEGTASEGSGQQAD